MLLSSRAADDVAVQPAASLQPARRSDVWGSQIIRSAELRHDSVMTCRTPHGQIETYVYVCWFASLKDTPSFRIT